MEQTIDRPSIDLDKVLKVYSGKPNRCMCGCSGFYRYPLKHRELGGEDRGYPVDDDEVNDKTVRAVVKKVAGAERVQVIDGRILTAVIGSRQYTVYTTDTVHTLNTLNTIG